MDKLMVVAGSRLRHTSVDCFSAQLAGPRFGAVGLGETAAARAKAARKGAATTAEM